MAARKLWVSKATLVIAALVVLFLVPACMGGPVSGQFFPYPAGGSPLPGGYKYLMEIDPQWHSGGINYRSSKNVRIMITDASRNTLLDESFQFSAARIRPNANWWGPGRVDVTIRETGDLDAARAGDSYNSALLASGPRALKNLTYLLDQQTGVFRRAAASP